MITLHRNVWVEITYPCLCWFKRPLKTGSSGVILLNGLSFIPSRISNHLSSYLCDEITHPSLKFNGATVVCSGIYTLFHSTLFCVCDYSSILWSKLIHVSKNGPQVAARPADGNTLKTLKQMNVLYTHTHQQYVSYNAFNWHNCSRWRHQIETFSVLLALCEGNPPVTHGFPSHRPVTRSFDVLFDLNKRLSKQSRRRLFETPSRSLWRPFNVEGLLMICLRGVSCEAYGQISKLAPDSPHGSRAAMEMVQVN